MKKGKLLIFSALLASSLTLSGCLSMFFKNEPAIEVNPITIDVVETLKLNLQGYNEKTLTPTLSNSSIKDPVFEFTSSNSQIATVSSSGVVTGVSVGTCNVTVALQTNKSIKKDVAVTVVDEEVNHYKYTLMFYMCGSDLEYYSSRTSDSEQWFFTRDIQEMLSVKNIPDSVRIIIETGGTKKWQMPSSYLEGKTEISSKNLQRWEVNNQTHKLKHIETLSTNEMASESSFADFLSWGLDSYEADQMGVVISGHGGGIAGCAYDDNYTYNYQGTAYPNVLQTFEVANAAKTALANSERDKFTWIGYDCCLMQCADIATINSDYFEYMVASQELENATGWNHDEYLPYLVSNPDIAPTEFLPKICDAFLKDNHSNSEGTKNACLQTLSVLDLSKTNALVSSFEEIVPQLGSVSTAYSKAKSAFEASFNDFGEKMYGLCDFTSLLKSFSSKYSISTTAAQQAVADLVIYSKYCSNYSSIPCGVNAFFPDYLSSKRDYDLQVGREDYENKDSTKFTKWQALCLSGDDFGW